jgi:hypothetical protein
MRRYDGNNNGAISFGGKDGGYIGLSRDQTERALTELEGARFIVETAPAEVRNGVPRKWRLTIYGAIGEKATKDFMRTEIRPQKSFHGVTGADDKALNVSPVRTTISPMSPARVPLTAKTGNVANTLHENCPISDIRAGDTFEASDISLPLSGAPGSAASINSTVRPRGSSLRSIVGDRFRLCLNSDVVFKDRAVAASSSLVEVTTGLRRDCAQASA